MILRSDPDADGVELVDRLQKDFPREFQTVMLPEDQELDLIDLHPYFYEREIQREGSSMLRWALMRISSMNTNRLHQIRRLGWEWKVAHETAFRDADRFTAYFLREHGMENEADDFLEPIAGFLNHLRNYYRTYGCPEDRAGEFSILLRDVFLTKHKWEKTRLLIPKGMPSWSRPSRLPRLLAVPESDSVPLKRRVTTNLKTEAWKALKCQPKSRSGLLRSRTKPSQAQKLPRKNHCP